MKIAITGATGFLGRYLVQQLTAEGHQLRCWFRPTSDRSGLPNAAAIEWIPGDLDDAASCQPLLAGCDAAVHAALWRPGERFQGAEGNLVKFAEVNLVGSLRLIDAAVTHRLQRFVFISTCAVHDKILNDRPLDEQHPLWPASHYGAHKAALEKFVHSYGLGHGFPICAVRPTGIYGLAQPREDSKWYELVRNVAQSEPVRCRRGGKEVHAADVAKAVSLLLTSDSIQGEVYNCCDRYISEYDVALIAKRLSGSRTEIDGQPMAAKHEIDTHKIRALGMEFGGTPLLEKTIAQLLERPG
ncbi:MAG: NAD-dependent epimerase/dehydratase family protein [Pirellulaceae bacterium]